MLPSFNPYLTEALNHLIYLIRTQWQTTKQMTYLAKDFVHGSKEIGFSSFMSAVTRWNKDQEDSSIQVDSNPHLCSWKLRKRSGYFQWIGLQVMFKLLCRREKWLRILSVVGAISLAYWTPWLWTVWTLLSMIENQLKWNELKTAVKWLTGVIEVCEVHVRI